MTSDGVTPPGDRLLERLQAAATDLRTADADEYSLAELLEEAAATITALSHAQKSLK